MQYLLTLLLMFFAFDAFATPAIFTGGYQGHENATLLSRQQILVLFDEQVNEVAILQKKGYDCYRVHNIGCAPNDPSNRNGYKCTKYLDTPTENVPDVFKRAALNDWSGMEIIFSKTKNSPKLIYNQYGRQIWILDQKVNVSERNKKYTGKPKSFNRVVYQKYLEGPIEMYLGAEVDPSVGYVWLEDYHFQLDENSFVGLYQRFDSAYRWAPESNFYKLGVFFTQK